MRKRGTMTMMRRRKPRRRRKQRRRYDSSCNVHKGPVFKSFMGLVVIIEAHDVLKKFWIW